MTIVTLPAAPTGLPLLSSASRPATQSQPAAEPPTSQPEQQFSPLERQRRAIATALGEQQISLLEPRWLSLMREGVIVTVRITRWRAVGKLSPADLGLPEAEATDLIELGEKRLLPRRLLDALNSVESNARKCLARHAYTTFWGYFVPAANYQQWKQEDAEYQRKYLQLRDELVAGYDNIKAELLADYAAQARLAYRRAALLDPKPMTGGEYREEAKFVQSFTQRVADLIPSMQTIRDSFSYTVGLSYVPLPSLLAEDEAAATRIRSDARDEQVQAEARRLLEREVMQQAQAKKVELVDGFLANLVGQLRGLVYNVATDVLASIQHNDGKLLGKSADQLRNLVARVGSLNFFGDEEVDAASRRVEELLEVKPKQRDVAELQGQLQAVATITRATLLDLGEQPRSARSLGVEDAPTEAAVVQARRTLGVEAAAEAVVLPARRDIPLQDAD